MSDGNTHEGWEGKQFQVVGEQTGNLTVVSEHGVSQDTGERQQVSPKLIQLRQIADRRAFDDVDEIKGIVESGRHVNPDVNRSTRRGKAFAKKDISNDYLTGNSVHPYTWNSCRQ